MSFNYRTMFFTACIEKIRTQTREQISDDFVFRSPSRVSSYVLTVTISVFS